MAGTKTGNFSARVVVDDERNIFPNGGVAELLHLCRVGGSRVKSLLINFFPQEEAMTLNDNKVKTDDDEVACEIFAGQKF